MTKLMPFRAERGQAQALEAENQSYEDSDKLSGDGDDDPDADLDLDDPYDNDGTDAATISEEETKAAWPPGARGGRSAAERQPVIALSVAEAEKAAFAKGEIEGMSLSSFLRKLGSDRIPAGKSKLWYKGDGADGGTWLFVTAPAGKGQVREGYQVLAALGRDGKEVIVDCLCLLSAEDRNGENLKYQVGTTMKKTGDKIEPGVAMREQDIVGRIRGIEFGLNVFTADA